MEEAASLFGPADSSLDPFGNIVGNGSDDLAERTSLPSELPPPEVDSGSGWYNDQSGHYQSQGSLHPEYSWQSGDAAAGHYNSQPRYGGSTSPSSSTYRQRLDLHEGDHSQYLAPHDAGHVYHTQQHYTPSTVQVPFERRSISQSGSGLPGDSASSTLYTRAAHAQPTFDPYGPTVQQPMNVGSSSMFPEPPLPSLHDSSAVYPPHQPISSSSPLVPQSGYQPYSVPANPPPPQVVPALLGAKDTPPGPSQATALYRPKTSNAYDPPIPPPKPTRYPSGAPGSSRILSPTSTAQGYAAQGARHVGQHTNAVSPSLPDRYAGQAPAPLVSQLVASTSPPRHDPHPRIVPRSSVSSGHSVGAPHYPTTLGLDPHRNILNHTSPHNVLSNGPVAEDTLVNELGYPVTVSGNNGTFNDRTIRPNQRGEFTERKDSLNTSLSNPYDHLDTGGEYTRPITNNGYSRAISPSPPIHTGKYELSGYTPTLERTQSPSGSSVHSSRSSRRDLVSPPKFAGSMPRPPVSAGPATDPQPSVSRVSSPASIRSWKSPHISSHDPYAPARSIQPARDRSMSNSSLVSSHSSVASDRYAPSRRSQNQSEASIPELVHHASRVPVHDIDRSHVGQTLTYPAQTHPPYAPSPSLLGSNDPLGRTSSRAPVVSFGFGGKMVICFHGSNTLNTGFDIALSSRQTTGIQLRPLHAVIPESALGHISTSFPGPLFCDRGSPTGLVRPAAATQSKSNKAKVIKYLEERAEEISRGLNYLGQGTAERKQAEGKHVLVRLLKVLLEHDGHLSGSPQVEASVRAVLVPEINDASGLEQSTTSPKATLYGLDGAVAPLGLSAFDPHDRVLSVQTVKSSALDKIQDLLARGERTAAYRYALDERLWAHAMVIASSIDKEAWKEVVNEFTRSELNSQNSADGTGPNQRGVAPPGSGREPLKVAYSLYSGQGAASVQGLVPPISLIKSGEMLHVPTLSLNTPISANTLPHTTTVPIHADVLSKWPVTAAMLIPGPSASECSAALVALGDCLLANQWVEAAQACYLLAPQSGALGAPAPRVALVGSRGLTTAAVPNFHVDDDAIVLTEIMEFAFSLTPLSKGQEPYNGLSLLQPYKLVRAVNLAEMGHMSAANRYCEAITACLSRVPTGSHLESAEQLRELNDRLVGAPLDKTGSWIGGKMARPSLDSFGNWLGGRLTDFVAGGDVSPTANGETTPHENKAFAGPFSHYSTISSSTTSKAPSPQPTVVNDNVLADAQNNFPLRAGSAQAVRLNPHVQIDRASSAMEYRPIHRDSSSAPRIASASAATAYFSHTTGSNNGYPQASTSNGAYQQPGSESPYAGFSADTWWGSSSTEESTTTTPMATMFPNDRAPSPSGFVSLMDGTPMPVVPTSGSVSRFPTLAIHDDDDLGLGNSSGKHKTSLSDSSVGDGTVPDPKAEKTSSQSRPGTKPIQQPSGWFSRWWSREGSSGPVKATLGEESSFVYDKELKRWVNKKAGDKVTQPSAPPPPPARAQTTSPGHTAPRVPTGSTLAPPPARAASAIDLTASPPKRMVPRPRSTLASTEGESYTNGAPPGPGSAASPPPVPSGSPTPPPSRPRSQATKRNLRSRYVDVFQQPTVET